MSGKNVKEAALRVIAFLIIVEHRGVWKRRRVARGRCRGGRCSVPEEDFRGSLSSHGNLPSGKHFEAQGTPALTLSLMLFCTEMLTAERLNVKQVTHGVVIALFQNLL